MQEADYKSPLMILAALAFALGITVVGTIQLAKDRYFSEATTEYVIKIKNLLRREALVLPN